MGEKQQPPIKNPGKSAETKLPRWLAAGVAREETSSVRDAALKRAEREASKPRVTISPGLLPRWRRANPDW